MNTNTLCDKWKKNEIQIYNEYGNCCIPSANAGNSYNNYEDEDHEEEDGDILEDGEIITPIKNCRACNQEIIIRFYVLYANSPIKF